MCIEKAATYIEKRNPFPEFPKISLTLGSGLGFFAENRLWKEEIIPYGEIPGFAASTVVGHEGNLIFGKVKDVPVVCLQGRFHFYEGYGMEQIVFPMRVLARLGVVGAFLSNAAGGIHPEFSPGTLMLISDHINFMGTNPLIGKNDEEMGPRFPDLTSAWDPELRGLMRRSAEELNLSHFREGVYAAMTGPSFETPAEIRALRVLGADAVGMSTVSECIAAVHAGVRVVGVSCITNAAAGLGNSPLTHEEVGSTAAKVESIFSDLLESFIPKMSDALNSY